MKHYLLQFCLIALISFCLSANVTAKDSFITNLNGLAYYSSDNDEKQEVLSFAKIPVNSEIILQENSNLQIVYLSLFL